MFSFLNNWWEGIKGRTWSVAKSLADYLPRGVIAAATVVGVASAIKQSGALGSYGELFTFMGANTWAEAGVNIGRAVLISGAVTSVIGLAKYQSHDAEKIREQLAQQVVERNASSPSLQPQLAPQASLEISAPNVPKQPYMQPRQPTIQQA